jgi:hypothetical protein
VERTLTNTGNTPLTVLVALSPKPSFANQSSPRRNAPRRQIEADEAEIEVEGRTEQAGFDESRSGPTIGRARRPAPRVDDDRPRGRAPGGFGPMRRDTFDNRRAGPRPFDNTRGRLRSFGNSTGRDLSGASPNGEATGGERRGRFSVEPGAAPRGRGPSYGGSRNGRPAGGRPYRDTAEAAPRKRMPGSVAGSTAPSGRVRDAGPDSRPASRAAGRPAGGRSGPARPRRAAGPEGGSGARATGAYSERGAAGRRNAPRKARADGDATRRQNARPAPGRNAPRTSRPRSPRA